MAITYDFTDDVSGATTAGVTAIDNVTVGDDVAVTLSFSVSGGGVSYLGGGTDFAGTIGEVQTYSFFNLVLGVFTADITLAVIHGGTVVTRDVVLRPVPKFAKSADVEIVDPTQFTNTVTGTLSVAEAKDLAALSGAVIVSGAMAKAEQPDVGAITGLVIVAGTLARTEAQDSSAASATVNDRATVTATERRDSESAAGIVANLGTMAATAHADTMVAAGTVATAGITGTIAVMEQRDASAASGALAVLGSSPALEARDAQNAAATVTNRGTAAAVESRDVPSASGVVQLIASLSTTTAPDSITASARLDYLATQAVIETRDASAASGALTIVAVATATEVRDATTAFGLNLSPVTGTSDAVETGDAANATGVAEQPAPQPSVASPSGIAAPDAPRRYRSAPPLPDYVERWKPLIVAFACVRMPMLRAAMRVHVEPAPVLALELRPMRLPAPRVKAVLDVSEDEQLIELLAVIEAVNAVRHRGDWGI